MNNIEIYFTGIHDAIKPSFETSAKDFGFTVRKGVTKKLHILVTGPQAGPVAKQKAKELNAIFLTQRQFEDLIEIGYLPIGLLSSIEELNSFRNINKPAITSSPSTDILINADAQPIGHFNDKANKQKALHSLKGILIGISCDKMLNNAEVLFLDIWLKTHDELYDEPDTVDLMDAISDVVNEKSISADDYDDLLQLIEDVVDYSGVEDSDEKDQINTLIGVLNGITADNELNDEEIYFLGEWLSHNENILESWPASVVAKKLIAILKDGVITKRERKELIVTIQQVIGVNFTSTGDASDCSTQCFDEVNFVDHKNADFCFTGKFVSGARAVVENTAKSLGARTSRNIKTSTRYLVVGSLASRDWAYSSHGKKIEEAMRWKSQGYPISIISEDIWLKFINK